MVKKVINKILSAKKIKAFLSIIGLGFLYAFINAIASDIGFWKSLLNIPVKIFSLIIYLINLLISLKLPDIVLLILILVLIVWLILISIKLDKPIELDDEKFIIEVENLRDENLKLKKIMNNFIEGKYKPEEDEQAKFKKEHGYVLTKIVEAKSEIGLEAVFEEYQKKFSSSRIEFKCIVDDLIRLRMIRHTCNIGGDAYYQITREGLDYFT